jgi:hypothetical protein
MPLGHSPSLNITLTPPLSGPRHGFVAPFPTFGPSIISTAATRTQLLFETTLLRFAALALLLGLYCTFLCTSSLATDAPLLPLSLAASTPTPRDGSPSTMSGRSLSPIRFLQAAATAPTACFFSGGAGVWRYPLFFFLNTPPRFAPVNSWICFFCSSNIASTPLAVTLQMGNANIARHVVCVVFVMFVMFSATFLVMFPGMFFVMLPVHANSSLQRPRNEQA